MSGLLVRLWVEVLLCMVCPRPLSQQSLCAVPQCAGVLLFKSAGEYSYPVLLQQLLTALEAQTGSGCAGCCPLPCQSVEPAQTLGRIVVTSKCFACSAQLLRLTPDIVSPHQHRHPFSNPARPCASHTAQIVSRQCWSWLSTARDAFDLVASTSDLRRLRDPSYYADARHRAGVCAWDGAVQLRSPRVNVAHERDEGEDQRQGQGEAPSTLKAYLVPRGAVPVQSLQGASRGAFLACTCIVSMSLNAQVQLMDMVYRKALRLNTGDVAAKGVGGIVNLLSNDVKKLERLPIFMHSIWEGPMQVRHWRGLVLSLYLGASCSNLIPAISVIRTCALMRPV